MSDILNDPVWILTWKRPEKLNRLIGQLLDEGFTNVNVMSSSSELYVDQSYLNDSRVQNIIINSLNEEESNAWCARSWNTFFIKGLKNHDSVMCFQDDTTVKKDFGSWFSDVTNKYDFLWGPAGDQWFFLKRSVLASVGYWDERFLSCWCGDADFVRRIYQTYDKDKLSIEDSHPWGMQHNSSGITQMVNQGDVRPWIPGPHINQHQHMEALGLDKVIIKYCIDWYYTKWGVSVYVPINDTPAECKVVEPDWYPWFTRTYLYRPEVGPEYKVAGGRWDNMIFYPQRLQEDGSWKELSDEIDGKVLFKPCDGC